MKKINLLLTFAFSGLLLLFGGNTGYSQSNHTQSKNHFITKGERPEIDLKSLSGDAFIKGVIRIKLKRNHAVEINPFRLQKDTKGKVVFGLQSLDALNDLLNVRSVKPLFFALGQQQQKFTSKHQNWDFDLWYTLELDESTDIKAAVLAFSKLKEIESVEPEYKKRLIVGLGKSVLEEKRPLDAGQGRSWIPNDEYFGLQWHYHNTGQESGTQDADIDLPEAWDLSTGNPNVIVAIIDGGIDYNHTDIAPNMWEGIGYNFVNNSPNVTAEDHGTHVAGTVAAASGNTVGVAGIAGGSGSGNGVRLMSAQVFMGENGGGFHLAPIWAADNGAAISQNSWGYTSPGVYNQAELDAIDYFNQNGGGIALLGGGITIFAAGNDGSSADYYPGYYSATLSVASTNNQDIISWYSNYGLWVDISAPGGETSIAAQGVLSTLPGNTYGFYQGTSMACPHVSGVAALIASMAYGQVTNTDVWNILVNSTDDIYTTNPGYTGQLGSGRLNAYNALVETQAYLGGIANPINFAAVALGANEILLSWELNQESQNVLLAISLDGNFGIPNEGANYQPGDILTGGGLILFSGNATSFNHLQLEGNTTYFYKLWSVNDAMAYSPGVNSSATTSCGVQSLPFTESFDTAEWPSCWLQTIEGASGSLSWTVNNSYTAGGQPYEMHANWQSGTGTSRLISPPLDLSGSDTSYLSFKHYFDDYSSGCQIKIQTSTDGVNWIDQAFQLESGHGNYGPVEAIVTLTNNSNATYIAWVIEGIHYQFDNWYVDDVIVQSTKPVNAYSVTLLASPEEGGSVLGGGLYPASENVIISAEPSPDYFFIEWQKEVGTAIKANPYIFAMPEEDLTFTALFNPCTYYPTPINLSALQITGTYMVQLTWQKPALAPDFPQIISSTVYLNGVLLTETNDTELTAFGGLGEHEFCVVLNYEDGGKSCDEQSCFVFTLEDEAIVNGTVRDFLTAEVLPNATVNIFNDMANYTFVTNENGFYEGAVLSGTYDFSITANGYVELFISGVAVEEAITTTTNFGLKEFPYPVGSVFLTEPDPGVARIEWPLADPGWLHYDDGVNIDGLGGPATFSWAIKFDASQLLDYQGFFLEKVALFTRTSDPIEISICEGTNGSTVLHQQTVVPQAAANWESFDLTSAVPIDKSLELWIICYTSFGSVYPAGCGESQNDPNGNLITLDGNNWGHLTDYGLNYTWNLQAYVNNGRSQEPVLLKRHTNDRHFQSDENLLAISNLPQIKSIPFNKQVANDSRSLTGYSVYRSSCYTSEPEWIAITTDRFYIDNDWINLTYGAYRYGVVAEYDLNQSVISYSNCMDKDMLTSVGIQITTNSSDSPAGTEVTFTNTSEPDLDLVYTEDLDSSGLLTLSTFRKGVYHIKVFKTGYSTISLSNVEIFNEISFEWLLIEILASPTDLNVTPAGYATWMKGVGAPFDPFAENFDAVPVGSLPEGWSRSPEIKNWAANNGLQAGGTANQMRFYWSPSGTNDFYLKTPVLSTIDQISLQLSFKHSISDYNQGYTLRVVAIADGTEHLIHEWLAPASLPSTTEIYTLTSAHGIGAAEFQIAWVYSGNSFNINAWYLDDVMLNDPPDNAARSFGINKVFLDGQLIAQTSDNYCQHDVSNLVQGTQYLTEVAADYTTGESRKRSFLWTYYGCENYPEPEDLVGNVNGQNVTLSWNGANPSLPPNGEFFEGFEAGTLPTDWIIYDVDNDGYNWENTAVTNSVFDAHSGDFCMTSASYVNNVGALNPNSLLVTPAIVVTVTSQLKFWIAGQDPAWAAEKYYVKVSTTGNAVANFTTTLYTAVATGAWQEIVVDLAAYAGQSIYIAFQHAEVSDMYFLKLDDVTVTNTITRAVHTSPLAAGVSHAIPFKTQGMSQSEIDARINHTGAYAFANVAETTVAGGQVVNVAGASKSLSSNRTSLYNNGPLVNSPGTGTGGTDESILQNVTLGMGTLGYSCQFATDIHMADDFVVDANWTVDDFTFYTYQPESTTTSTITGGYLQIYNGNPSTGGTVVWGDMVTNRMALTDFSNIYRLPEDTPGNNRPIMKVVCSTPGLTLTPGAYWVEFTLAGSLASGPWVAPITITGQLTTGNALQSHSGVWEQLEDFGSLTQQGVPFLISGTADGSGLEPDILLGTNIYRDGILIRELFTGEIYVDRSVPFGNHNYCVQNVYESGGESCQDVACVEVLVMEACSAPQNLVAQSLSGSAAVPQEIQLTWDESISQEFRYDDGVSTGQIGASQGSINFVIGSKHAVSATITELSWYLTEEGGPHSTVQLYVLGLSAAGMPDGNNVLYTASVSNADMQWNTHELPVAVEALGGFFIGIAADGFVGLSTDDGIGEPYVFQSNTHYYAMDYTSNEWNTLEGSGFSENPMIRAIGVAGARASYAIATGITPAEDKTPTSIIHSNKEPVATGAPRWSALSHDMNRAFMGYNIYKNGLLFEALWPETTFVYQEGQSGETCYKVTSAYEYCGESEPSETVCITLEPACAPGWEPVPNLQFNMQVLAQIMIDDAISTNTNDVLGAFVGDECRGIASPLEGLGMAFLSVGSNQGSGELVELKIWNSTLCEFCDAGPGFTFVNLGEIGTFDNPLQVSCFTSLDFNFGQGYTWFSENLALENPHPNVFFEGLDACNNDRLISQSAFSVYQNGSWNGTISALNPINSYRMKLCEAKTFTANAPPAEIVPIVLNNGYTWLGYLPQACLPVNVALANMNPTPVANDRLIGQVSFALYNGSQWVGSLTTLCPGAGYVIKLANPTTLVYPEASVTAKGFNSLKAELNSPTGIKPVKSLQHSMTVLGRLELPGGQYSNNAEDRVYAFANGQCVGMANPMETENGLIFMSVGENSDEAQQISFKIWLDEEQQLYEANETLTFVPLKGNGVYENPFKFSLRQPVNSENDWFIGEPYPNPFSEGTVIPYKLSKAATIVVKIYNSSGQLVRELEQFNGQAGSYQFHLPKEQLKSGLFKVVFLIRNEQQYINATRTVIVI